MATMTAEDVYARFQDLEGRYNDVQMRYNDLLMRVAASEEEHRRTHAEMERSKALMVNIGPWNSEFRLIDPKSMIPERLANRPQWRGWSKASRSYIENLSPELAEHLKMVEGREQQLTDEEIA